MHTVIHTHLTTIEILSFLSTSLASIFLHISPSSQPPNKLWSPLFIILFFHIISTHIHPTHPPCFSPPYQRGGRRQAEASGASCWGKWPSEALSTSGQADGFGSRAASATWGSFCSAGLTETLMLLELYEFCCAGVAHLSGAGLRCRRHGQLCFGAEGLEEPEAPRVENTSSRGWRRPGRDVPKGTTRPGRDLGLFRCRRCGALRHVAAANV
jgi:hypothetical protein